MESLGTWHLRNAGFRNMASSRCRFIAVFLTLLMTSDTGVFGRAVNTQELTNDSPNLRTDASRRWRRGLTEAHRERCAELAAPWLENTRPAQDNATVLQLRVRPFSSGVSRGLVFPEKSLFSFVRRVYHCCREGLSCRSVKGIQGRWRGGTDVEFLLTREILSLMIMRAELHLQLSNPQHLDVHPVLPSLAKWNHPTSFSSRSRGNTVELRVDLMFLFQILQEAAGGAGGGHSLVSIHQADSYRGPQGKPALQDAGGHVLGELGLLLSCSQAGLAVSCGASGVHVLHTPFMALYYL